MEFSENSLNASNSVSAKTKDFVTSDVADMLLIKSFTLSTDDLVEILSNHPYVSYAPLNY